MSFPRIVTVLGLLTVITLLSVSATEAKKGQVPSVLECIDFSHDTCSDHDGDGWIGEIEIVAGSDYTDANSTPEYGLVDEQTGIRACSDRVDNDGDGKTDRKDPGCRVTCHDYAGGRFCNDRDHDGWKAYVEVLYGSDPMNRDSVPETIFLPATCSDDVDNDADGLIDECGDGIADCIDFDADVVCSPF